MRANLRPILPREADWEKLIAAGAPLAAAAGLAWLKLGMPLPPCTFKHLTGCPCCGCGSTRAAHALLDARPLDALALNPLATAAALALAALWIYSCAALLLGDGRRLRVDGAPKHLFKVGMILLVTVNWTWVLLHLPESPWKIS